MHGDPLFDQFTAGAFIVWILEALKRWKAFSFLDQYTDKWNRFLSALLATLVTSQITFQWDPSTATASLAGLTAVNIATFIWHAGGQFFLQEGAYRLGVKPYIKKG